MFNCARVGVDIVLFLYGFVKRYPINSREMTRGQVDQQKKAQHKSFNSSQEPVCWLSQKRTDYHIQLFSCIYFIFNVFFFYQLKKYKQRKIIFFFALGLKKASRDLLHKGPSLCIKTGSTVQIERSFENLSPQLHRRKKM